MLLWLTRGKVLPPRCLTNVLENISSQYNNPFEHYMRSMKTAINNHQSSVNNMATGRVDVECGTNK